MTMLEKIADAINSVELFARFNDWTSDRVEGLPIEICVNTETVIARYSASIGQDVALAQELSQARARAVLETLKHPDEGTVEAMALRLMQRKSFETPEQVSAAIFATAIEHIQKGESS